VEEPLRLAIMGCGWAGTRHAHACRQCGVEVRWAIDLDIGRAESLHRSLRGTQGGIWTSTDYRAALDDPDVDAVDICLPHNLHAPVVVEAAGAGKHVLCEKPLAATLEGADRMIEVADRAGVVLMVAENVRFHALLDKVRDLLRDGAIGQPALIQMTRQCYLARSFLEDRRWFLDAEAAAGGIMMSGGIHDFETMRMLIGEVESVYSLRAPQRFVEMGGDDTSVALVRFGNGAVGTLVESFVMKDLTTASGPEIHTLRIDGDLGSLSVREGEPICLFSEREDYLLGGSLMQHEIYVPKEDSFVSLMEHFVHCVRTGEEPVTSGRSQRKPLAIVLAAYESMKSGQPVRVDGRLSCCGRCSTLERDGETNDLE
jgi:predicted dehydrogenase